MKKQWLMKIGIVVAAAVSTALAQAAEQDFSADPGWTGSNNGASGNRHGHDSASGAVGGTLARAAIDSCYGDTKLSESFDLSEKITASGQFTIAKISEGWTESGAGRFFIGHFSTDAADNRREFIGLEIENHDGGSVLVRARFQVPGGNGGADSAATIVPATGSHRFQYTYDPALGEEGDRTPDGRLTLTLDDKTIVVNLSGAQRKAGARFDAFGLGYTSNQNTHPAENRTVEALIDDVSYSGR